MCRHHHYIILQHKLIISLDLFSAYSSLLELTYVIPFPMLSSVNIIFILFSRDFPLIYIFESLRPLFDHTSRAPCVIN